MYLDIYHFLVTDYIPEKEILPFSIEQETYFFLGQSILP